MAGPSTAERDERRQPESGPPSGDPPGPGDRPGGGSARRPGSGPARPAVHRPGRLRVPLRAPARRLALLLSFLLLCGFAGWALYGSTWLRVERVTVSGTRVLTPGEVRAAAAVRLHHPLISVDTDVIAERLRRALPRIDSVDVARSWPHGIGLKVIERTPALVIEKGGKFTEVDAKGVRFATVSTPPKGVPELELATNQDPSGAASMRRFGPGELIRAAVRVAGDLPASVARQARVLKVRSYDSISVELTRGRSVVWGSSDQGTRKGRSLTALMKAVPHARHFDVSVPTAPAASSS